MAQLDCLNEYHQSLKIPTYTYSWLITPTNGNFCKNINSYFEADATWSFNHGGTQFVKHHVLRLDPRSSCYQNLGTKLSGHQRFTGLTVRAWEKIQAGAEEIVKKSNTDPSLKTLLLFLGIAAEAW
ncbi:hypothetical protein NC653_010426 [Populus alba x Populus x berolinensis]|uniref:Uncharacterized protein n=1 Tax=Populus alba x Populus x berolinensis TaxID=444605 RepID=A0AAD6W583_9ROSI|nr:hypothetical protein NC653_010426 [Populus alba x Populus x berolinensis]